MIFISLHSDLHHRDNTLMQIRNKLKIMQVESKPI